MAGIARAHTEPDNAIPQGHIPMTLTELRYVVALEQTQHFGKAAAKCFVSQPTLSIAIKKIEEELGVSLFERSRNKVHTTPLGERVILQAKSVLKQASIIKDIAAQGKDPLTSTLSIGAIFTVGPYLFPHFVPNLKQFAPGMPLYIEENYTSVLREKLRNCELDAIVIARPFDDPEVVCQNLYEEDFVVLLHKNHPLRNSQTITPKQLEQEQVLLLGEKHCFRGQILAACPGLQRPNSSDPLQSVVEGSSLETLKYMVASGLGVTVLPASAAQLSQYGSDSLITRPLLSTISKRTIALAWRASFSRHRAIDALIKAIGQCHLGDVIASN